MYLFLDTETYERIIQSLYSKIREYYEPELPSLLGFGVSGQEVAEKLSSLFGGKVKTFRCDVIRKEGKIQGILNFPEKEKIGSKLLICDTIVDTGKTMEAVVRHAWNQGIDDAKTLSVVARDGSSILPNFYAMMVAKNDLIYFPTIREYPITVLSEGLIREIKDSDLQQVFKCGDPITDNLPIGQYLGTPEEGALTFVIEEKNGLIGLLQFYCGKDMVEVTTLATAIPAQNKGCAQILMRFLTDWCRFNQKRSIKFWVNKDRALALGALGISETGRDREKVVMTLKIY